MGNFVFRHFRRAGLAIGFLTVLPVPHVPHVPYVPGELARAASWFPWVGLLIGGALWLTHSVAALSFGPFLAAVITVGVWAALTGALHLDGVADCCDGLLPPVDRERRLEIMRDPRVGAFGVVGLVMFLAAKIGAVAELVQAWPALLLAPVWARWLLLWVARAPGARPGGMGAVFGETLAPGVLWAAALLPVVLLVFWMGLTGWQPLWMGAGTLAAGVAGLGAWAVVRFARARIGGVTGDVLGLAVEVCELLMLLVFAAFAHAF